MTDDSLKDDLSSALTGVTKQWKKAKKKADRVGRAEMQRVRSWNTRPPSIKEVAFDVIHDAYLKASGDGKFWTNARQIMYAARPMILEQTDTLWSSDSYFTQTILKEYLELYGGDHEYRIVWDARGNLTEPHTRRTVPLGGLPVMKYVKAWTGEYFDLAPDIDPGETIETHGPSLRFGAALWIEKEGFAPILEDAGIGKRYDLAIMSSKGMTTKAAVEVAQKLSAEGVQILVVHDFDKSGFEIVKTIRRGTRLLHSGVADVIDVGLRLADIEGLEREPVTYKQRRHPRHSMKECGVTDEEQEVLVSGPSSWDHFTHWNGERVELNAMTSDQFVKWLEAKLDEHGVEKVVPEADVLAEGYRRAIIRQHVAEIIEKTVEAMDEIEVPDSLAERVRDHLALHPADAWEHALAVIAEDGETD